jgi:single-strand DNA-binding protein
VHEIFVTVMGNVASRPKSALTKSGHSVASFRLASTPRRYDRSRGSWTDGTTTWFTVTCWRGLADHVASSVTVGDPLIVHGRLQSKEFTREDGSKGSSLDIEATSAGHDLTRGTSMFKKGDPRPAADSGERDTTAEDLARQVTDEVLDPEGEPTPAGSGVGAADPARAA